jgi:enterochelin esterase-like enzyme
MKTTIAVLLVGGSMAIALAQQPAQNPPAQNQQAQPNPQRQQGPPATEADIAELSRLATLRPYASGRGDGDYSIGPDYTPAPEQTPRAGVPQGKVIEFTMHSADSKIYPGLNGQTFDRAVAVYVPAQYVAGTDAPFIVSFDQYGLRNKQLPTILDNMIADKRLPVMAAVMVANGGRQRSMEYDTVSAVNADFLEAEVYPASEKAANVKLTKNPDGRMSLGGSSGGIAAFTLAWFRPERYHRVVSYSGTFTALQRNDEYPDGGWEYHEHLIPGAKAKPIRAWLHVSENDIGANSASAGMRNWPIANVRMARVLKQKGYHYQFVYSKNSGHVDGKVIAQTLPQALEYVWKGYPIARK